MNNFEKIKQMDINEFANYIRSECVHSLIHGVALDTNTIKEWLQQESEE